MARSSGDWGPNVIPGPMPMFIGPFMGGGPMVCANIAARAAAAKPRLPTPAIPASPPVFVSTSTTGEKGACMGDMPGPTTGDMVPYGLNGRLPGGGCMRGS